MNADENMSFFRESFKGFNKDDVVAFIQKLSKDYSDNEEKYKEKITNLIAENKLKTEEAAAAAAALQEAETKLRRESEQHANKKTAEIAELKKEIERLNQSLEASSANVDKYKDDVNKLLKEVRSKETEIIELQKNTAAFEASGSSSGEIENLKIKYTDVLKNNEELKYKLDEAAKIIKEMRGSNTETVNELSNQVAELSKTIEKIKNEKEEAVRGIDAIKEERDKAIEALKNQFEQNKSKVEDEQKIYENITAELGSIVYSAKKSAEEITAKAAAEAEDIIARANMKKLAIIEENEKNIARFKNTYGIIKQEHEKMMTAFNIISENYSSKLLEIKSEIDNVSANI